MFVRSSWILVLWGALAISACGDEAEDEITNTVNCSAICGRYSECVQGIDVTSCADRCEDNADVDNSYAARASSCEDCVENGACGDVQGCWASCPVVPVQD